MRRRAFVKYLVFLKRNCVEESHLKTDGIVYKKILRKNFMLERKNGINMKDLLEETYFGETSVLSFCWLNRDKNLYIL